jgi:hypothetical protein
MERATFLILGAGLLFYAGFVVKTGLISYSSSTYSVAGEKRREVKRVESPISPWILAALVAPVGVFLILAGTPVGGRLHGSAAAFLALWAIARDVAEYGLTVLLLGYGLGAVPYGLYKNDHEQVTSGLVILGLCGFLIGVNVTLAYFFGWARKDLDGFLDPYRTLAGLLS